ncbi:bifunctional hydroxymethylpyrimidine kinase/phosphomethylpyrimidine kinase [Albimonas sp. CAU 1670]|uniref:bifunctional hydroxymethylpyrimidine kinase/phosphomethylpyrimidine kinase n=1 Tax=Albimonas sp. CAU 1670 TaxID=3032599 RepID=UPI0023DB8142|nr:bifunctional hydroxymethylpyrimidine kinase/phosphomethylpyrimidine kinase [Albimonas sp. CAU 1670]MDF2232915.1 bifunctional hydroxymethylpyrimidine kinase/phosphomethylpyrimidine kinase [Albimonas sp. CAU 1670]
MPRAVPNVLSIAGSDPSGGAGIQADLKAISANGAYAMAAITGLTVQNTRGVRDVAMMAPAFVAAQVEAIFDDVPVDAVKLGMLGAPDVVQAVAEVLAARRPPQVVLDPVMVAKGGARLLAPEAEAALRALLPLADVLTPNLPEAAVLLGAPEITTEAEMEPTARALLALGPRAVLLKGGHLPGDAPSPDLLVWEGGALPLPGPRIATRNAHGAGCTLSSALAAQLALTGGDLPRAARLAKDYVTSAMRAADGIDAGGGHGPLDHFFALRA